jgi:hypothetical protein
MLNKIKGRPLWYKAWTITIAIAALYTLIIFVGVLLKESFEASGFDYLLLFYVNLSILLEIYFFPETKISRQNKAPE